MCGLMDVRMCGLGGEGDSGLRMLDCGCWGVLQSLSALRQRLRPPVDGE